MGLVRGVLAGIIVAAVPGLAVLGAYGLWRWTRWMRVRGLVAVVGVALTLAAVGNLGITRTCDAAGHRARPGAGAVLEAGACRRSGLAQVDFALLTGLAATLATIGPIRR